MAGNPINRFKYWLLFVVLFPGLAIQGLWLRRRAPRFAPAAGEPRGVYSGSAVSTVSAVEDVSIGVERPLRVLGLGDSIIAGVGARQVEQTLTAQFARALARELNASVQWRMLGRSGADSGQVLAELVPQLEPQPYDVIVISLGVNDVSGLVSTRRWRRQLTTLFNLLRCHSPYALILFLGLPPLTRFPLLPQPLRGLMALRGRILDAQLRALIATESQVVHVPHRRPPRREDFAEDGYHPNPEAYERWAQSLTDVAAPLIQVRDKTSRR